MPLGPKFWNPKKIRKKYQNTHFWCVGGIFSVFSGYFGGKFWESRISGRGVFYRYFSWKFQVGPFRGSVAGRGVLKFNRKHPSSDAILFGPQMPCKTPQIITLCEVLEPFKQTLWASRDVIIWSELQRVFFTLPPGTKPTHAGKNSWGIDFRADTCGACIRMSANTGKYFWGIIFEICIRTLAPALCIDIVPVFAHPWCQYIKIFLGN